MQEKEMLAMNGLERSLAAVRGQPVDRTPVFPLLMFFAQRRHGVTYRFELRRWPRESGLKLAEACPAAQLADGEAQAGCALPIAHAGLFIQRKHHMQRIGPSDESAVFTVPLEEGLALLHTWFYDDRLQPLCGAYYVCVTRVP
jgi:hypothetical protein